MCVFFPLSLPLRLSFVSVVFVFSDSLNDVAPLSPVLFSFEKKSELLMNVFCVCLSFVFTPQIEFNE